MYYKYNKYIHTQSAKQRKLQIPELDPSVGMILFAKHPFSLAMRSKQWPSQQRTPKSVICHLCKTT